MMEKNSLRSVSVDMTVENEQNKSDEIERKKETKGAEEFSKDRKRRRRQREKKIFRDDKSAELKESRIAARCKWQQIKDEPDVEQLQLEPELLVSAKLFERYRNAMLNVYISLIQMMRRGNASVDMENIKSESGRTAPERLYKKTLDAYDFWKLAHEFQPALNESLKTNLTHLGALERGLQEKGPKHLKKIRKFIYRHYSKYIEVKRDIQKMRSSRENEIIRQKLFRKMERIIKKKCIIQKQAHFEEIQSALVEIMMFHRFSEQYWCNIAEFKVCKTSNC